jgi:Xaa-Pro dipeptidase
MTNDIVPISHEERLGRLEKARKLMKQYGLSAIYIEAGTSLFYFTGINWWPSERMFAFILPQKGKPVYICPKFEEGKASELITIKGDVYTWEEDQSPYKVVVRAFKDMGIGTGPVGMEERVRFFLFDGIRQEMPAMEFVSADPVTIGCRVFKSPAEIALMQRAMDITVAAYKVVIPLLREGMTKKEFIDLTRAAHKALGVSGGIGVSFGLATSFPHGSRNQPPLKEGDVVLMDGGCGVEGYRSDISRTVVFGDPTPKQRDIWELERKTQAAAFEAVKLGSPCEAVDDAAREVLVAAGMGPDYKLPGLPHRTGHGIGLDGHEWTNFVRGNKTPIQPGMCFTNEPMIVIPGEFGIRLEDCLYITEEGPKYFTEPSPSIDRPFV